MFGRRSASEAAEQDAPTSVGGGSGATDMTLGKGRATPKRKEAEAQRKKRLTPPRNKKEASALNRQRVKEQRVKQREALSGSGDDKYLPARDRGPVKKFARDYVDSHRTLGEFLIPVFVTMFLLALLLSPYTQFIGSFAWLVVLAALALDSVRIMRGMRKALAAKFGAVETKGITMYTLMRAWQMRRLRLPKPAVRPGAEV